MTAILYPIAADAQGALAAPLGRAARARDAEVRAGEPVDFVTTPAGPLYATREAALDAWAGRVEDERRPGAALAAEDRFCRLVETVTGPAPPPARPVCTDGRRWPAPPAASPPTAWRLHVSFWRPRSAEPRVETGQARQARRQSREPLDAQALRRLTAQPLRPLRPQQPLDIGLFETRLPESPHIIVPDE